MTASPTPREMAEMNLEPCPFCGGIDILVIPPNCKRDDPYDTGDHAMPIARCLGCYAEATGENWDATCDSAIAAWNRRASLSAAEKMAEALRTIAEWRGKFPPTDRFWDEEKTRPMSYAAAYGSNGERDYMRMVARTALADFESSRERKPG